MEKGGIHHPETNGLYEVLDTADIINDRFKLSVRWLNDTIEVTQSISPEESDTLQIRINEEVLLYGPNCFSYSLDAYFKSNQIDDIDLFGKRTVILTESLTKILESTFSSVQEFQVRNKRLKNPERLPENAVLIFKNRYEMISHAVYYNNGIFYSKNGMYPPQKYSNIHKILKTYWDTGTIEAYQLKPAIKEMLFHTP